MVIPAGILEERINYIDVEKKVVECIERSGVRYEELYITPIRGGFKVEILPTPAEGVLREISECISERTSTATSIVEYLYGRVITAKVTKTTQT